MNPLVSSNIKESKKKVIFALENYPINFKKQPKDKDWRYNTLSNPNANIKIATMFS